MNKEEIKKIGEYLNLKYVIARDVNSNDKLETQDRYIQQLYDAYLDLRIKYNDLQAQLEIANKKLNDYNEMIIKVISECEEMINDRYYMNDTAILKKAELIKGIANHYYIVEPKWIGGE